MRALWWLVCLAACDAGAKPAPPAPIVKEKTGEPVKQQVTTAGFDLAYLPGDSDVVVHVDLARLRQSKLWATYADDVAKLIAPAFVIGCDYTPVSEARTLDAGIPITSKVNVLVFRGIDRDKALACLREPKTRTTQSIANREDIYTVTSSTNMIREVAFIDGHTMVVRSSPVAMKQSMQDALKASADAPLSKNADFVATIARSKMSAGVLVVSRPNSEALSAQMNPAGMKLNYFAGTVDLNSQLVVHYSMKVGSETEAKTLASMMKTQLESQSVKAMFDKIETTSQGDTLTLDFALGETKLATMSTMLRGLLPAP